MYDELAVTARRLIYAAVVHDPADAPDRSASIGERAYVLLHVRLPDRPGALGLVASRIGGIRGDIVSVSILDRSAGAAFDQLTVELPSLELIPMLVREVCEVDGVEVEAARVLAAPYDPIGMSLDLATRLIEAGTVEELHRVLTRGLMRRFLAAWVVLVDASSVLAAAGFPPPLRELLPDEEPPPEDLERLARSRLPRHDTEIVLGRSDHRFFPREHEIVRSLARVADMAWSRIESG